MTDARPLRVRTRRVLLAAVVLTAALPLPAAAQEACKPVALKHPALKLDEAYRMAEERAKAWKPDAAPARITNTILGPLRPDGSSEAWNILFHSASANAHVAVNTFRGQLTCWAQPGSAGRMPDLKPGFVLDGAKLHAIAKQHGEKPLAEGYFVTIGTAAAPSNRHATWNINFSKADGKSSPPTILVDANTGAVEKVLK